MRQMGISVDDVTDPSSVKTRFPTKATSSNSSPLARVPSNQMSPVRMEAVEASLPKKKGYMAYAEEYREPAVVPMEKPVAVAAPSSSTKAREEFLKSLGIDNMDVPDVLNCPQNDAVASRASQEYVKKTAALASHDSNSGNDDGPRSFIPQRQPDITLGIRKAVRHATNSSPEPSLPISHGVERELDGLSVDEIKNMGNRSFEEGDFRKAIRLYTRAIERDPSNAALYSNRSACYLQAAKQMGIDTRTMALRDADKTVELRPDWFKGYSRKGDALFKLERYSEAAVAYERGLALDPQNTNLMHSLGEARNSAGNIAHQRSASWSTQPAKSENLRSAAGKSARELLEEMKESMQRESKDCMMIGNDYRTEQLRRFREGDSRSTSSLSNQRSHHYEDHNDTEVSPDPLRKLDKSQIEPQFSSEAAAAYQQKILEEYRRKKAARNNSSSSFTY